MVSGPPGLGQGTIGGYNGFEDVGDARTCFSRMVRGLARIKEIAEHVESDQLGVEKCVKEFAEVSVEMIKAVGAVFEQEPLRFIDMVTAAGGTGAGEGGFSSMPRGSWSTG